MLERLGAGSAAGCRCCVRLGAWVLALLQGAAAVLQAKKEVPARAMEYMGAGACVGCRCCTARKDCLLSGVRAGIYFFIAVPFTS